MKPIAADATIRTRYHDSADTKACVT